MLLKRFAGMLLLWQFAQWMFVCETGVSKTEEGRTSQKDSHDISDYTFWCRHQAPKKMKKKTVEGGSNVFSMFEQSQIQEFKEVRWEKFLLHGPKPNILRMWLFPSVCLKYCGKYFCFHPQSLNHQFELDVFNFSFVMATALLSLSIGLHYHGPEQRRLHW